MLQCFLEFDQPVGMDSIIVRNQDPRHKITLIPYSRLQPSSCTVQFRLARSLRSVHLKTLVKKTAGEISARPVPCLQESNKLIARDPHAAFFLVSFARKSRLEFCLLAGRDKERVFLRILNDLFSHDFALEAPQCAFNRFTLINCNYCHSFSAFLFLFNPFATGYLTRPEGSRSSGQRGWGVRHQ